MGRDMGWSRVGSSEGRGVGSGEGRDTGWWMMASERLAVR